LEPAVVAQCLLKVMQMKSAPSKLSFREIPTSEKHLTE